MSTATLPPDIPDVIEYWTQSQFASEAMVDIRLSTRKSEPPLLGKLDRRLESFFESGIALANSIMDGIQKWRKRVFNRQEYPETNDGVWRSHCLKWITATELVLDVVKSLAPVFPKEIRDDYPSIEQTKKFMEQFQAEIRNWKTPKWGLLPSIREVTLTLEQAKVFVEIGAGPVAPLPEGTRPIKVSREEFLRSIGRG